MFNKVFSFTSRDSSNPILLTQEVGRSGRLKVAPGHSPFFECKVREENKLKRIMIIPICPIRVRRTKTESTRKAPFSLSNVLTTFKFQVRVSALTEGAIVSGLGGRPDPRASHHQIMTHLWLLGAFRVECLFINRVAVLPSLADTGSSEFFSCQRKFRSSASTSDRLSSIRKNERQTTMKLPRNLRIVTTDDFRSGAVRHSFSTNSDTRVGTIPNTKIRERGFGPWYSRKALHEHPYWTSNLKYVQ